MNASIWPPERSSFRKSSPIYLRLTCGNDCCLNISRAYQSPLHLFWFSGCPEKSSRGRNSDYTGKPPKYPFWLPPSHRMIYVIWYSRLYVTVSVHVHPYSYANFLRFTLAHTLECPYLQPKSVSQAQSIGLSIPICFTSAISPYYFSHYFGSLKVIFNYVKAI